MNEYFIAAAAVVGISVVSVAILIAVIGVVFNGFFIPFKTYKRAYKLMRLHIYADEKMNVIKMLHVVLATISYIRTTSNLMLENALEDDLFNINAEEMRDF